jgi:hypothetical protein
MFILCLKRLKVAHLVLKQSKVAPDTKLARGCSKGKKLLKTPKVAHKLPSTIYKGLPLYAPPITNQYFPPPSVKTPFLQISAKYWKKNEI